MLFCDCTLSFSLIFATMPFVKRIGAAALSTAARQESQL